MTDVSLILTVLPHFALAAGMTAALSGLAICLGLLVAAALAAARLWGGWAVRAMAAAYISVVQGTPCLVHLFLIWFGAPLLGWQISAFGAGVLGLGLNGAAYMAEAMRAAVLAVPIGQSEAARALGLPPLVRLRLVILPQAARLALPPLGAQAVALVKTSALVGAISVVELTQVAQRFIGSTYRPFLMTVLAGVFYLALIAALRAATAWAGRRLAVPG